ncbi:MAG TPA: response regulator, partial [Byssovorax sp.]
MNVKPPPGREVLVVDDDPAICETLQELLEDEGYRVSTAANGVEALEYLMVRRGDPPGLILLDFMMPVMNGVELLDQIAADVTLPRVPVVVLSANAGFSKRAHQRDIVLYLSKPVSVAHLLETV